MTAGTRAGRGDPLIALTATWDITGFPVAALPAGLGARTGLPVGVSLVARPGDERRLVGGRHRPPGARAGAARPAARPGLISRRSAGPA